MVEEYKDDEVLYRQRLHIKFFLKQLASNILLVILCVTGIIGWQVLTAQFGKSLFSTKQVLEIGPLPVEWVVIAILVILIVAAFATYRTYYEWQYTFIEVTWWLVSITRPTNRWLWLFRPKDNEIGTQYVGGFDTSSPTFMEEWFFRDCRTGTVKTIDFEGSGENPVRNMADIQSPDMLKKQIEKVTKRYARGR